MSRSMTSSTFPNDRSWRWPSAECAAGGARQAHFIAQLSLLLRQALRSRFRFLRLGLRTRTDVLVDEIRQLLDGKVALLLADVRQQLRKWHCYAIVLLYGGAEYDGVERLHA